MAKGRPYEKGINQNRRADEDIGPYESATDLSRRAHAMRPYGVGADLFGRARAMRPYGDSGPKRGAKPPEHTRPGARGVEA